MSKKRENPQSTNAERRKIALSISYPLAIELGFDTEQLSTGWDTEEAREYLLKKWNIKERDLAKELLHYIEQEGERATYQIILPYFLLAEDKENRKKILEERYMAIDRFIRYSDNLSDCLPCLKDTGIFSPEKSDYERGTLAWDMALLVTIARISFDAKYIEEKEALQYIDTAYKHCRKTFRNWNEIGKSFVLGEAMRKGNDLSFANTLVLIQIALTQDNGVWNNDSF